MKNEVMSLFSTPLTKTNIGRSFTKEETECIANIPICRDEKERMTNHRSEDYYLFDNFNEELKDIKIFCGHEFKRYLENIEGVDTTLAGLRITQSWLNNTKPQEFQQPHYHPNSYLSGVLYITCLPNDSINFDNRSHGMCNNMKFQMKKKTAWNSIGVTIKVTEGDLIIFPSWIPHSVNRNETKNKERISLSFNTFPIGELGVYHNGSHLKL